MKSFMDENFMLHNQTAQKLYWDYAAKQPIFDYHCHLSAQKIYENEKPENITQLWLYGDHYKWRLMRSHGIDEKFITGTASDWEKFLAYSKTISYAIGNPLFHWTHLELQRYFHIDSVLSEKTAKKIWEISNSKINKEDFSPRALIEKSNVYALCTTEDPLDSLEYHKLLINEKDFSVKILPSMRPDSILDIRSKNYIEAIQKFSKICNLEIKNYDDLKKAFIVRMKDFDGLGCLTADHGFEKMPFNLVDDREINKIFQKALLNDLEIGNTEVEQFQTALMIFLAKEYHRLGWAMQLHLGPVRNRNTRKVKEIGESCGFDSIGDHSIAIPVASFMDELEKENQLPKTVLFSINEKDNTVLATMLGNFQDSSIPSKIQFGTAWWFQDHRDGMEKQIKDLANAGLLGHFIGMLTDSRSFLSYPRHEYFRRIICNLIGQWVEQGEYPYELEVLGELINGISFYNAKKYFNLL